MGAKASTPSNSRHASNAPENSKATFLELQKQPILKKRLRSYLSYLLKNRLQLNSVEISFIPVTRSLIINVMGKKHCESYQKSDSFTITDLMIMRSICKVPYFDVDRHSEVVELLEPLKETFRKGKKVSDVLDVINYTKNIQAYRGCSFTAIDYQLLDILEYIAKLCVNQDNEDLLNAPTHWTAIFAILFRGTNIKLSNRSSKQIKSEQDEQQNSILFQCFCQNSQGQQESIDISMCRISYRDSEDTLEQNDDKEAIFQSDSILANKLIFDNLPIKSEDGITNDLYPIGIHLSGYDGYLYSIRPYKDVYVASQVCRNIIFLPRTLEEFKVFLNESQVLEIFCNLKRHYINIVKAVQQASLNRNLWLED